MPDQPRAAVIEVERPACVGEEGCMGLVTGRYSRGGTGTIQNWVFHFSWRSEFGEPLCKRHALARYRSCSG